MPTVAELAAQGMATRVGTTQYRLTEQGHRLLGEIMARNGERWRTSGGSERSEN